MTKFDKEYIRLGKTILNRQISNRVGIDAYGVPNYNFEFDLKDEFPILTIEEILFRQAVLEMLSIWQVGTNEANWLQERDVNILNQQEIDADGIWRLYEEKIQGKEYVYDSNKEVIVYNPMSLPDWDPFGEYERMQPKLDDKGNVMKARSLIHGKNIIAAKYFGKEHAGTYGTSPGYIAKKYRMAWKTEQILKTRKTDCSIVNNLCQPDYFKTAVFTPNVYCHEFIVQDNTLNLIVNQKCCNVPLELPINITQYATYLKIMAQISGLEARKIYWNTGDAHIYVNQIEIFKEQISRWKKYQEMSRWSKVDLLSRQLELSDKYNKAKMHLDKNEHELLEMDSELRIIDMILNPTTPELWLNPNITSFFDFDNSKELKDIKILNYKHMSRR